jgi:hypothetical protein
MARPRAAIGETWSDAEALAGAACYLALLAALAPGTARELAGAARSATRA